MIEGKRKMSRKTTRKSRKITLRPLNSELQVHPTRLPSLLPFTSFPPFPSFASLSAIHITSLRISLFFCSFFLPCLGIIHSFLPSSLPLSLLSSFVPFRSPFFLLFITPSLLSLSSSISLCFSLLPFQFSPSLLLFFRLNPSFFLLLFSFFQCPSSFFSPLASLPFLFYIFRFSPRLSGYSLPCLFLPFPYFLSLPTLYISLHLTFTSSFPLPLLLLPLIFISILTL